MSMQAQEALKQYIFMVTSRNIKSIKNNKTGIVSWEGEVLVEAIEAEYNLPGCLFFIKYDKVKNNFVVKDIIFKGNEYIQENEVIGYLKGYFGFTSEESINKSLLSLKETINICRLHPIDPLGDTTWGVFSVQFTKWFERKLKPCLDKEFELHYLYHNTEII